MKKILFQFPQWRFKSLVMSYDDGTEHDRRLVEIFNRHGIKGTFHLCSGLFGKKGFLKGSEVKELFAKHEVSSHTATHPSLSYYPLLDGMREVVRDRENLEKCCGYPVQSMSYPCGALNDEVVSMLKSAGIACCRTTCSTNNYCLPQDFLRWHPSCHHRDAMKLTDGFINHRPHIMRNFFIWGHSYEFESEKNWDLIEDLCATLGGKDDIWYAGMSEIARYTNAVRNAVSSVDGNIWYNPSAETLYFLVDDRKYMIAPGEVVDLKGSADSTGK